MARDEKSFWLSSLKPYTCEKKTIKRGSGCFNHSTDKAWCTSNREEQWCNSDVKYVLDPWKVSQNF